MIATEQLASNSNALLKYICGYWETTKILSNTLTNEINTNENYPECGSYNKLFSWQKAHYICTVSFPFMYTEGSYTLVHE